MTCETATPDADERERLHLAPGLHESNDAPHNEVLAVRPTTPRIQRSRGHCSRKGKVRDDALAARRFVQLEVTLPGGTVFMQRLGVNSELTKISTEAELFFDRYAYPDWLRAHSVLVGRIAETIVSVRSDLMSQARDIGLAGYLHDIGRSPLVAGDKREHNELSALILAAEGLAGSVEPARRHAIYTVLDPVTAPATLADKIVYVADRRGAMKVESVEERARDTARRHPRYASDIERAIPAAKAFEQEVFGGLPFAPDELEAHLIA